MDAFVNAFIKPPVRVLGRRLHPLCAWHVLLLEGAESPFARGEAGGPGHLRLAVTVCAQDPATIGEDTGAALERIEREVHSLWWRTRTWWHSYPRALATYVAYWRSHLHGPPVASTVPSRRVGSATAPWVLGLVARAGGEPRHWCMALDRLAWEIASRAEAEAGAVRFKSEAEVEFEARVRARMREAAETAAAAADPDTTTG